MAETYQVQIDVTVHDLTLLRAYALKRALEAKLTQAEFEQGEYDLPSDNVRYWLGWAFDNGSPDNSGVTVDESRVEEN